MILRFRIWWYFSPTISKVTTVAAAWCAFWFVVVLLAGCAAVQKAESKPCPPSDLAKIETEFMIEATRACRAEGAKSVYTCKAYPAIRDKYRAERADYVRCSK